MLISNVKFLNVVSKSQIITTRSTLLCELVLSRDLIILDIPKYPHHREVWTFGSS